MERKNGRQKIDVKVIYGLLTRKPESTHLSYNP